MTTTRADDVERAATNQTDQTEEIVVLDVLLPASADVHEAFVEEVVWSIELPGFERQDDQTWSALVEEPRPRSAGSVRWRLSFTDEHELASARAALHARLADTDVTIDEWTRDVTGYRTAWREFFRPAQISPRFWVHPPWEVPAVPDHERVEIDPGMAFGTGTHETSRLCAKIIDELSPAGLRVLDVGTGSAILLIIAGKLGAIDLVGVDIDADAVREARRNLTVNGLPVDDDELEATQPTGDSNANTPARVFVGSAEDVEGTFDLVIANMLPHILRLVQPHLLARVAPGGRLILSGIPVEQLDEVTDEFVRASGSPGGLVEASRYADGEWSAVVLSRASQSSEG